jgi:hypothetical protein
MLDKVAPAGKPLPLTALAVIVPDVDVKYVNVAVATALATAPRKALAALAGVETVKLPAAGEVDGCVQVTSAITMYEV